MPSFDDLGTRSFVERTGERQRKDYEMDPQLEDIC